MTSFMFYRQLNTVIHYIDIEDDTIVIVNYIYISLMDSYVRII